MPLERVAAMRSRSSAPIAQTLTFNRFAPRGSHPHCLREIFAPNGLKRPCTSFRIRWAYAGDGVTYAATVRPVKRVTEAIGGRGCHQAAGSFAAAGRLISSPQGG